MAAGFTLLLAKIVAFAVWIGELALAVFVALWDWIRDAACWPFEQAMKIALKAIGALNLSALEQYAGAAGNLPGEMLNILQLLGAGTCIGIIVAAITVRLLLQLIPFTRLGS